MKFYPDSLPSIDEVTMCTVLACNPATGFTVHLDEYDVEGFLINKELSAKKIRKSLSSFLRVGTQLPLAVIEAQTGDIVLSKKDVNPDLGQTCRDRFSLNVRLFSLARRLSHMTATGNSSDLTEDSWASVFRAVQDPDVELDEHPYVLLGNRSVDSSDLDLDPSLLNHIVHHHAKLFGIQPLTLRTNFIIQTLRIDGMNYVKDVLVKIRDSYGLGSWSNEELHQDPDAVNVAILPLAIPTFQLQITAYRKERVQSVLEEIKGTLNDQEFDFLEFQETSGTQGNES